MEGAIEGSGVVGVLDGNGVGRKLSCIDGVVDGDGVVGVLEGVVDGDNVGVPLS